MKRVLLTGGRAPATLELARQLAEAGHFVVAADSVRHSLCSYSRACPAFIRYPPPRQQYAAFVEALLSMIRQYDIDVLIPTCEETFYVARAWPTLSRLCQVFCEPISRLEVLHNKYRFNQLVRASGLPAPETLLLTSASDLQALPEEGYVLKPAYSRFASSVLLPPLNTVKMAGQLSESRPWVAQTYLQGKTLCSYSVAHQGRLAAHSSYYSEVTSGQGAAIAFQHVPHEDCRRWVEHFVEHIGYSGQIAFDFIETTSGLQVLECNPRSTSGLHLFRSRNISGVFVGPISPCLMPDGRMRYRLTAALLAKLLRTRRWTLWRQWWLELMTSQDAIWNRRDPLPSILQGLAAWPFVQVAFSQSISLLAASTYDIEWNGYEP